MSKEEFLKSVEENNNFIPDFTPVGNNVICKLTFTVSLDALKLYGTVTDKIIQDKNVILNTNYRTITEMGTIPAGSTIKVNSIYRSIATSLMDKDVVFDIINKFLHLKYDIKKEVLEDVETISIITYDIIDSSVIIAYK